MQQEKTLLNGDAAERYGRQIALPEIGQEGQKRLQAGRILLVGIGGLGSPAGYYLAAAGVGTIGIMDPDTVSVSNLQRQILHRTADVGRQKVESAATQLEALNPGITVVKHAVRLDSANRRIVEAYDFVVDATDNLAARMALSEACHRAGKPYSHAGISGFSGQAITVMPGRTCCYRCLFEVVPEGSAAVGIGPLGVVPGVMGTIQAAEAIRYLLGIGRLLTDRLLVFDALEMTFREVTVRRNPSCALCGTGRKDG